MCRSGLGKYEQQRHQVRIIGGIWRNTRLQVPALPGVRPTSSRVRETLFNWLSPYVEGALVLDLFAGSGALGLEALSRGASLGVFVEQHPLLCSNLGERVAFLQANKKTTIVHADATAWLNRPPTCAYDIVFCDPPFSDCQTTEPAWFDTLFPHLACNAWIYLESPRKRPVSAPGNTVLHRCGTTSEVHYALYRRVPVTLHDIS